MFTLFLFSCETGGTLIMLQILVEYLTKMAILVENLSKVAICRTFTLDVTIAGTILVKS